MNYKYKQNFFSRSLLTKIVGFVLLLMALSISLHARTKTASTTTKTVDTPDKKSKQTSEFLNANIYDAYLISSENNPTYRKANPKVRAEMRIKAFLAIKHAALRRTRWILLLKTLGNILVIPCAWILTKYVIPPP